MDVVRIVQGLDNLPEAREIRQKVFVEEQRFDNEFDLLDDEAYHILIQRDGKAAATGRLYRKEGEAATFIIGRIAVLTAYRGQHLGSLVVEQLEKEAERLGAQTVRLSAQVRAREFYEKMGYRCFGEEFMDEHVPHIWMEKTIQIKEA